MDVIIYALPAPDGTDIGYRGICIGILGAYNNVAPAAFTFLPYCPQCFVTNVW
jgi:hypothetical protein